MKLYNITGDKKFIRFMDKEYKATYNYLFDKEDNLFYRDHRYFTMKGGEWRESVLGAWQWLGTRRAR